MRHTRKDAPHFQKCVTLENGALENMRHKIGKMRQTWKNAAHMEKCSTVGKMRHLGKMRYTWKIEATWKNGPR